MAKGFPIQGSEQQSHTFPIYVFDSPLQCPLTVLQDSLDWASEQAADAFKINDLSVQFCTSVSSTGTSRFRESSVFISDEKSIRLHMLSIIYSCISIKQKPFSTSRDYVHLVCPISRWRASRSQQQESCFVPFRTRQYKRGLPVSQQVRTWACPGQPLGHCGRSDDVRQRLQLACAQPHRGRQAKKLH